jgi:hypothetical protein
VGHDIDCFIVKTQNLKIIAKNIFISMFDIKSHFDMIILNLPDGGYSNNSKTSLAAGYIILLFGFEAILRILYPTPYKNI